MKKILFFTVVIFTNLFAVGNVFALILNTTLPICTETLSEPMAMIIFGFALISLASLKRKIDLKAKKRIRA